MKLKKFTKLTALIGLGTIGSSAALALCTSSVWNSTTFAASGGCTAIDCNGPTDKVFSTCMDTPGQCCRCIWADISCENGGKGRYAIQQKKTGTCTILSTVKADCLQPMEP